MRSGPCYGRHRVDKGMSVRSKAVLRRLEEIRQKKPAWESAGQNAKQRENTA